jgi:NaMN:DMB phosphoribosyltransferase
VNADSRHLLDGGTWFAAAVAVVSLSQLAFALTIIATTISIQGQLDALTDFVFNEGLGEVPDIDAAAKAQGRKLCRRGG